MALNEGPSAAEWLSAFLEVRCRLVRFPDDATRRVDPEYGGPNDQVGFADGFSFLLTSCASLDDLNHRLAAPLPMNRFRPNIVVSGGEAFEEDRWTRISHRRHHVRRGEAVRPLRDHDGRPEDRRGVA